MPQRAYKHLNIPFFYTEIEYLFFKKKIKCKKTIQLRERNRERECDSVNWNASYSCEILIL